jgi:hypothetical protein
MKKSTRLLLNFTGKRAIFTLLRVDSVVWHSYSKLTAVIYLQTSTKPLLFFIYSKTQKKNRKIKTKYLGTKL